MKKNKVILYIRVSDIMQEEKESLSYQKKECLAYCKNKGYQIYRIIEEVGSAWVEGKRKGFEDLKEEIEQGNFDKLILYSFSRLARNQYLAHSIIHRMKNNNIKLEVITEPFLNSDSPMNGMILAMFASQAELESELKSKIVKRRMREYAKAGYWLFPPPRGYDLKENILYPNSEACIIKEMFDDYISGIKLQRLSEKYGVSTTGINNQISNVAYIGKTKFGFAGRINSKRITGLKGEIFEGKHKRIIDNDIFYKAQEIRKNRQKLYSSRNDKNQFILNGLLKYKGYLLRPRSVKRKNGSFYDYYRYQPKNQSDFFMIQREIIDSKIIEELKKYSKQISLDEFKSNFKIDFTRKIALLKSKRNKTIELYTDSFIDKATLTKKIAKIDTEIKSLTIKSTKLKKNKNANVDLQKKLNTLMKRFDKKSLLEKNKILKIFIEEIIVEDKENVEIIFKI